MSLLIKNVEMPTDDPLWLIVHADGTVEANEVSQSRPVGWQTLRNAAAPVYPHGKLIDADALLKGIANDAIWKHDAMNEYDSGIRTGARAIMRSIRNAHTIIEAEKVITNKPIS